MACLIGLNSEEVRQPGKFQNLAQVVSHHGSQFLILAVIQDGWQDCQKYVQIADWPKDSHFSFCCKYVKATIADEMAGNMFKFTID